MSAPLELNGITEAPICKYSISATDGSSIQTVKVGDLVKHEWNCSTTPIAGEVYSLKLIFLIVLKVAVRDNNYFSSRYSPWLYIFQTVTYKLSVFKGMYSMLVHSCYVEDGAGERHRVVDEHGCSVDKYALMTPHYASDRLIASVEAYVLKFPDNPLIVLQIHEGGDRLPIILMTQSQFTQTLLQFWTWMELNCKHNAKALHQRLRFQRPSHQLYSSKEIPSSR
uniref:ZP domain-containing protein n=1 Tax=Heterorhabditis bacteriophora TaxID=37862 RepID=A0A1I7WS98_HETBA